MSLFSRKQSREVPRRRQVSNDSGPKSVSTGGQSLFKRNRTLTGSVSSRVSSANEQKTNLKSPRTHAHELSKQRRKLGSVLGVTVGASLVLMGILFQFTARPVVSAADQSVALDKARYEKVIDDYLTRHPVERLRFVLNVDRLSEYVQRHLPEVATIHTGGAAGFGASSFDISVRKPLVSWMIGDAQYFVDATGVSFQKNYYDIPSVRIVDESGVEQVAGTTIASSRFLNFVGRAVSLSKERGLSVEQAIIPADTTRQVALRIEGHDYPIKLSLDRSVGEQVEDMQHIVSYFKEKKETPKYVDVRVAGKAFYKL